MERRIIYCWFGGNEKSSEIQECIKTWKKNMPDWEYIEINESNFDINYNEYVKKAYECKKWAFVSDVARLWALYNYGGIYMDTDVIVYKPLDKFLNYDFFTGFEQLHYPVTATIGSKKGCDLIKEMLDVYESKTFELKNNWYEYETNTKIMSNILGKYFNRDDMNYQEVNNMAIFPRETFCYHDTLNEEVYTKHCMFGSWG